MAYSESADSIFESLHTHADVHRVDLGQRANRRAIAQLLTQQPRVIVVVGTEAVQRVRQTGTDVPLIYAMVLDPASLGLPAPGDQTVSGATGVSMSISLETQFQAMREMFPDGRTIGVLYDPDHNADLIERALEVSASHGFDLITQVVRSEGQARSAARLLLARVDGFWSVADPTVLTYSNARMLLLQSLRARRPFFAISEGYVRSGAFAAVAADPHAVGQRVAEMALHVAQGGEVRDVPPEEPAEVQVFLNRSTAGRLGLALPRNVLGRATREVGR